MIVLSLSILVLFGCSEPVKQPVKIGDVVAKIETAAKAPVGTSRPEALKSDKKVILCFGNSLTEGYGLKNDEAYPALLQQKIDSLGFKYRVVNAGLSGETTAGGKGRLNWVLQSQKNVKMFILELGPNDGLRGVLLSETKKNLQNIIDTVKLKLPDAQIVLVGMKIPPNIGANYTAEFQKIFPDLADSNKINLIPFLLEGVAGYPKLNQEDGIHPTAEGTKIVIENVWKVVQPLLKR